MHTHPDTLKSLIKKYKLYYNPKPKVMRHRSLFHTTNLQQLRSEQANYISRCFEQNVARLETPQFENNEKQGVY